MTKKTRIAIVITLAYEIVWFSIIASDGSYRWEDFTVSMILLSIPTLAYWAWVFINSEGNKSAQAEQKQSIKKIFKAIAHMQPQQIIAASLVVLVILALIFLFTGGNKVSVVKIETTSPSNSGYKSTYSTRDSVNQFE